jgi:hypothetical protein
VFECNIYETEEVEEEGASVYGYTTRPRRRRHEVFPRALAAVIEPHAQSVPSVRLGFKPWRVAGAVPVPVPGAGAGAGAGAGSMPPQRCRRRRVGGDGRGKGKLRRLEGEGVRLLRGCVVRGRHPRLLSPAARVKLCSLGRSGCPTEVHLSRGVRASSPPPRTLLRQSNQHES